MELTPAQVSQLKPHWFLRTVGLCLSMLVIDGCNYECRFTCCIPFKLIETLTGITLLLLVFFSQKSVLPVLLAPKSLPHGSGGSLLGWSQNS